MLEATAARFEQHAPTSGVSFRDTTFAVVDVETTGFSPSNDGVVEVACIVMRPGRRLRTFTSLVNPGRPIPEYATAIHTITDAMVERAPTLAALAPTIVDLCAGAVVVAHNARFDLSFLTFLADRPLLCSMRFAQHVIPDAPNYKNQGLRQHLGLDRRMRTEATAHRALGDVEVTTALLEVCLERWIAAGGIDDCHALIAEITGPRMLPHFSFGRYRDVPIEHVPTSYLDWLVREAASASADARHTATREIDRRARETEHGSGSNVA